jgi:hypothetical protein
MAYQRRVDRRHPACIIFLLDQSGSMEEPIGGHPSKSKAEALAEIVNDLLHSIVRRCVKDQDGPPRHYYDLGVVGYAAQARLGFGGALAGRHLASVEEVANAALRVDEDENGVVPVWFNPVAQDRTAMCAAFDLAGQIASGWIGAHQDSIPPIVFNVSDGAATDGDPAQAALRLRGLHTADGALLLFNINLSSGARQPITFPADARSLPDPYSRQLFELSSLLPDFMRRHAKERGMPAEPGARGFVCNADMSTLIQALTVGTTLERVREY